MRPVGEEYTENNVAHYLLKSGIGKEIGFGVIAPEKPVTRVEYLTVLMHALDGRFRYVEDRQYFDDILSSTYCENASLRARQLGIIFGIGNNKFSPDASITKQDMITMTYRAILAFGLLINAYEKELIHFNDWDTIAGYAQEPICVLAEQGFIAGDIAAPKTEVSRKEAAQLIYDISVRVLK